MLQWSHNFIVMEILQSLATEFDAVRLQWGHNFIVMEIFIPLFIFMVHDLSFNGAITLSLWKLSTISRITIYSHSFNGAITLSLWKCDEFVHGIV